MCSNQDRKNTVADALSKQFLIFLQDTDPPSRISAMKQNRRRDSTINLFQWLVCHTIELSLWLWCHIGGSHAALSIGTQFKVCPSLSLNEETVKNKIKVYSSPDKVKRIYTEQYLNNCICNVMGFQLEPKTFPAQRAAPVNRQSR